MTAIDSGTRNGLRMTASIEADIEAPAMAGRLILIKGALRRGAGNV